VTGIRLEIWRAGQVVEIVERDADTLTLGSDPSCDVVIAGAGIAPRHVTLTEQRYRSSAASDLTVCSKTGQPFVVKGRSITPMTSESVWSGDVIELGDVRVIVDIDAADASLPVPPTRSRKQRGGVPQEQLDAAGGVDPSQLQAALLVLAAEQQKAEPDALEAGLTLDPMLVAVVMSHRLRTGVAPSADLAREICRGVAKHPTLAPMLPRLAGLPGWSRQAAHAYGALSDEVRERLAESMLGHPSWSVRLWAALGLFDLGEREAALRAVRRSFVASDFSPPMFTVGARPGRRIPVARRPDLPRLPVPDDALRSVAAPEPGPLVLEPADRELVEAARVAAIEQSIAIGARLQPAT
jgi:hypothetical protein